MLKLVERDTRLQGGTWKVPRSEENIFPSLIINVFPIRVISLDKLPSCTTFPTFLFATFLLPRRINPCMHRQKLNGVASVRSVASFSPIRANNCPFRGNPLLLSPAFKATAVSKREKRKKGEGERRTNRATMEESLNREVKTTKLARTALLSQTF